MKSKHKATETTKYYNINTHLTIDTTQIPLKNHNQRKQSPTIEPNPMLRNELLYISTRNNQFSSRQSHPSEKSANVAEPETRRTRKKPNQKKKKNNLSSITSYRTKHGWGGGWKFQAYRINKRRSIKRRGHGRPILGLILRTGERGII